MQEQLISFKTAELAKEKGLKRTLDRAGNLTGYNLKWNNADKSPTHYHVHTDYPLEKDFLFAPTQSSLQKWIREEYDTHCSIHPFEDPETYITFYEYDLISNLVIILKETNDQFETFEETLENYLQKALKLIP